MEPIISFKNFTFKYRSQVEPTLFDINLDIYPGEKVLIVGPSGSGKSTLSNCINGLVPFANRGDITGEYFVKENNPRDLGIFGLSKIVGTVMQDTDGQFIGLTVAEDIAFALENDCIEVGPMHERVDEIAKMVDVGKLLSHAPAELSGGQKQRVSMAGVMVDDVDILLFDEPLANLDPATGKIAIELIDSIQKDSGKTILIIEHRLEDVLWRHVDRIIVINEGRIVADTTPNELLSTDILEECGIREPLYVTALKYADCVIDKEDSPEHIDSIKLDKHAGKVISWQEKVNLASKKNYGSPALEVKGLDFSYRENEPILKDINFSIAAGEMLCIVGKNGAGKSTLSNIICGFYKPQKGQIFLNGSDIADLSIKERGEHIGYVMQNPNHMISKGMIYDEVALGLSVRGVDPEEIKERVYETLKICGLYPFRNWPISALSFGQKKRVTIASILVMNPEIIILDEPTAGQDYRHYTEMMEFIKKINEECNVTIIMITHDMHLMLEYSDRAIVLTDGRIITDSTPAAVLSDEIIANKAYLKKTSLYDLAVRCNIDNPIEFVDKFIHYEKTNKRNKVDAITPADKEVE